MAPYRVAREQHRAPAPPEPGLVADMVRQFADPYAFLRELVQNGMDAGARRIAVRVELMPDAVCATAVADDGSGMTREIIEGPLLTLFSSSKEGDSGKIGKYGVGFVSVFAIEPLDVEVETWRAGQAWRLRLRPDHSYELEDAGPREGSGTRVTLLQRMERDAFPEHAARAGAALRRWCRHADCEIELRVIDQEAAEQAAAQRIDTPLSVVAPVSITVARGDLTIVAGPSAGTQHLKVDMAAGSPVPEVGVSFAGFYNRGLTLFETADEVLEGLSGVRFKAMSCRFQHTLSRDNVRRDDAFREALAEVREVVRGPLRRELAARLGPAAVEAAEGRSVDAYLALLEAALSARTAIDPDEIPFPLAHPIDGKRARAGLRGLLRRGEPLLTSGSADALTEAVSRSGRPVVLCRHPQMATLLARCFPKLRVVRAREAYCLIQEVSKGFSKADAALRSAVSDALARARHEVSLVGFCRVAGAHRGRVAVLLPEDLAQGARLCAGIEVERRAARFRPGDALYLNLPGETVTLARKLAATDAAAAGVLLARALLVEAKGPLDADDSDGLLDLGEGGRRPEPVRR